MKASASSKIKILGISGSLRQSSSATAVLRQVVRFSPANADFTIYEGLRHIPPFDDSDENPDTVIEFIRLVTEADAVFFCIPEYAFGVPGVLKNALDWTVSSVAFTHKPVALITAASSGDKAHAALLLTLTALGTRLEKESTLLIPFIRSKLNEQQEIKDSSTVTAIKDLLHHFIQLIEKNKSAT